MADLTDRRVVHELEVAANAATSSSDPPQSWVSFASLQYEYHEKLLELMAAALAEGPDGPEQQAVYDAQAARVAEVERFKAACGVGHVSSMISR